MVFLLKLKRNSWHGKLNQFTWGKGYLEDVDCLCPYFWGTVAAIVGFPITLLAKGLIYTIEHIPSTEWTTPSISEESKDKVLKFTGFSMLWLAVFGISYGITHSIVYWGLLHTLVWIGIFVGIGAGILGLTIAISKLIDIINKREKRPNLLVEMFKAKKNKHCPLVSWID